MEWIKGLLEILNQNGNAITAVATAAIAALTYVLASENRRLRKAGTEPEVVGYLAPHPDGNGALNFVLANIGQGPARDVKFRFLCDEEDFRRHHVKLHNDPTRAALTILPQGEKIASLFGVGYVLFDNNPLKPFKVEISYRDLRGRPRSSIQSIDISQFSGLAGLLAKPHGREIADSLKKIEGHLGALMQRPTFPAELIDATTLVQSYRHHMKSRSPSSGGGGDDG